MCLTRVLKRDAAKSRRAPFERVDNGALRWYDLDLPDVIDLRDKLIPMNERRRYVTCSAFDTRWFEKILVKDNVLFIAAGVLYYFDEAQIKRLFLKMADRFPSSEIIFDASSPFGVKMANRMVIKRSGMDEKSFLEWGLKDAKQIEKWDKRVKVLDSYPYFCGVDMKKGGMGLRIKFKITLFNFFKASYMVHLKFLES